MNHRWKLVVGEPDGGIVYVRVECPTCGHVEPLGHFLEDGSDVAGFRVTKPGYLIRRRRPRCHDVLAGKVLKE